MIKIPDYQNDTIREISREIFEKSFNLRTITFSKQFSSDDYDYLLEKLPGSFSKKVIDLVIKYYEQDYTLPEIQEVVRKEGCPLARYVILAILKKNSMRFRNYGWRFAWNRKAVEEFLELKEEIGFLKAVIKITKKFALTRPTFLNLLTEKGIEVE
jgi:hypothetical protein